VITVPQSYHDIFLDLEADRLWIDLDNHGVGAARDGAARRSKVARLG
jgi:hypothetical protein